MPALHASTATSCDRDLMRVPAPVCKGAPARQPMNVSKTVKVSQRGHLLINQSVLDANFQRSVDQLVLHEREKT